VTVCRRAGVTVKCLAKQKPPVLKGQRLKMDATIRINVNASFLSKSQVLIVFNNTGINKAPAASVSLTM